MIHARAPKLRRVFRYHTPSIPLFCDKYLHVDFFWFALVEYRRVQGFSTLHLVSSSTCVMLHHQILLPLCSHTSSLSQDGIAVGGLGT